MPGLSELNGWDRARALAAFAGCCASRRWAERMADARPYDDEADLLAHADEVWLTLERVEWLEALGKRAAEASEEELRAAAADQARRIRAGLERLLKKPLK